MGSFEKLLVLTVIFLSAVVLAVSLTAPPKDGGLRPEIGDEVASGERDASDSPNVSDVGARTPAEAIDREAGSRPGAQPPAGGSSSLGTPSRGDVQAADSVLPEPGLRTNAVPEGASSQDAGVSERGALSAGAAPRDLPFVDAPETSASGARRILRDVEGLQRSPLAGDEHRFYTVGSGETWSSLAERFYGAPRFRELLRMANDADGPPRAGDNIFVPIYEVRPDRAPVAEARTNQTVPKAPKVVDRDETPIAEKPVDEVGETHSSYVVVEGDTLTNISLRVYGTASMWNRIWDANLEQIPNPDVLRPGLELVIP